MVLEIPSGRREQPSSLGGRFRGRHAECVPDPGIEGVVVAAAAQQEHEYHQQGECRPVCHPIGVGFIPRLRGEGGEDLRRQGRVFLGIQDAQEVGNRGFPVLAERTEIRVCRQDLRLPQGGVEMAVAGSGDGAQVAVGHRSQAGDLPFGVEPLICEDIPGPGILGVEIEEGTQAQSDPQVVGAPGSGSRHTGCPTHNRAPA